MNGTWVDEQWDKLVNKMHAVAVRSRDKLPFTAINGVHDDHSQGEEIYAWTNGFWGGLMWLLYIGTKDEEYRKTALRSEELLDGAFTHYYHRLCHDVGFMWQITSGVHYQLTGNEKSLIRAKMAADILTARFNLNGGFIVAWPGEQEKGWTIIDTMLNIPLLYWMSEVTQNDRYAQIAMSHADMTMAHHVRPDGSVAHIAVHNPETGELIETLGGQGYAVGSSWSRGQAWGLYGFILSYIHTKKVEYLDTAKKIAHYFIASVCSDWLPRADFRAPSEPEYYDSTAGAIAACGLIEIARNVPKYESQMYLNAALNLLKAVEEKCVDWSEEHDNLTLMGSGRHPISEEMLSGVHIPIIWGDYYFAEALYKLKGFTPSFE